MSVYLRALVAVSHTSSRETLKLKVLRVVLLAFVHDGRRGDAGEGSHGNGELHGD